MFPGPPDRARRSPGPLPSTVSREPHPRHRVASQGAGREARPCARNSPGGRRPARAGVRCRDPVLVLGFSPGGKKRREKRKAPRDPAGLSYQVPTVTRGAAHRWVPGRAGVRRAGWVPGEGSGWAVPLMSGPRAARRGFRPPHRGVHLVRIEANSYSSAALLPCKVSGFAKMLPFAPFLTNNCSSWARVPRGAPAAPGSPS